MNTDNTNVDYGPLALLIGKWRGSGGRDASPTPQGDAQNEYTEMMYFVAAGQVHNARAQLLSTVRYQTIAKDRQTRAIIHEQLGYWMFDPASGEISQTVTTPRGIALIATGSYETDQAETVIRVSATPGIASSEQKGAIAQGQFLSEKAETIAYEISLKVNQNELEYDELVKLKIYDREHDHHDSNRLYRTPMPDA